MTASQFWTAFALGIVFCAPPGPVLAEALRRGLHRGFSGALVTEFGSLVGDATWAALALSGVWYLTVYRPAATVLGALGVALLFSLAWRALRDARPGARPYAAEPPAPAVPPSGISRWGARASRGGDFAAGAALSLSNPQNVTFWLGVGGGAVAALGTNRGHVLAVFFIGFMSACVVWCFLMAAMIAWGRRYLSGGFYRWVNFACGVAMAYFGVRLLAAIASGTPVVRGP